MGHNTYFGPRKSIDEIKHQFRDLSKYLRISYVIVDIHLILFDNYCLIIVNSISSQEYFTPRIVDPAISGICKNIIKRNKTKIMSKCNGYFFM